MKKETISIQIQYSLSPAGATILRVFGRAAELHIPDTIQGMPVVAIGPKAFFTKEELPEATEERAAELSFSTEPPAEETSEIGQPFLRIFLPDTIKTIGADAFHGCSALKLLHLPDELEECSAHMLAGCEALEQVFLPSKVKKIGDYAFYNCRSLKALSLPQGVTSIGRYAFYNCRSLEQINLPLAAQNLGTGLFLNCDTLRHITFGRCRHIADLISVLNHELHLTIDFPQETGESVQARLIVPDFQYEYIEDTPARQFHQVNYGTGHIFRQCIGNSEIDFRRYDEIFYLTRREDEAVTVLLLAMNRLEYPYKLEDARREMYLSYLREHFLWAAEYFIRQNQGEKIRRFAQWDLITAENCAALLELAQAQKKADILSFLMDYQHKHFGGTKKKKTFEL